MSMFRVVGHRPLRGTLKIAGRKNAALPLIAASLLTTGKVTLKNVPEITDVTVMLEILEALGASVERTDDTVTIQTKFIQETAIPHDLGRKLRGSLLFLGPLVARFGQAQLPHPGGCIIGKRPVGLHFDVLEALGCTISTNQDDYVVKANHGLRGTQFFFFEASVTASENALMAAVLARGETQLINVATEDHVVQLATMLKDLGYKIAGVGTSVLKIQGMNGKLAAKNIEVEIIPDEIELGTFITAAVVTKGDLKLTNVGTDLQTLPVRSVFQRFGIRFNYDANKQTLSVNRPYRLKPNQLKTGTWPGVPTDLQPPLALLATQITGNTLIHDWMYEGRFSYVNELTRMGAEIINCDPHRILVHGPTELTGTRMVSPDLRAGATQLIAALAARGESIIEHAELIERGYEKIVERLQNIGASIERLSE